MSTSEPRWPAVPDYCAPLVGWRAWSVSRYTPVPRGAAEMFLVSGGGQVLWPPYEALEARHLSGMFVPMTDEAAPPCDGPPCSGHQPRARPRCGVYAFADSMDLLRMIAPDWTYGPFVIGTVSLWGRVARHARGYRAQFAYPNTIGVAWRCDGAQLASTYGVPYEEDAAWRLALKSLASSSNRYEVQFQNVYPSPRLIVPLIVPSPLPPASQPPRLRNPLASKTCPCRTCRRARGER